MTCSNIRSLMKVLSLVLTFVLLSSLLGCAHKTDVKTADNKEISQNVKKMPEKMTEVKLALPSKKNASYIPFYIAVKKGYFKKYNLDVQFTPVQGGVLALRGLQTGEFDLISSLPESVITGVAEGANVKLIGTLDDESMYSIVVTNDIKDPKDLKGKVAAGNVPGNGTTIQLEYWLKQHDLDPEKDVRIINAGDNVERLRALQQGQAKMTIVSPPTIFKAEELGFKSYLMRDVLKSYNGNMLVASNDSIKNKPEIVYAFMSAIADTITFAKDEANRAEIIKIVMEDLEVSKAEAEKSFDFVLPALADKGMINMDGLQWAIKTVKETGTLKKDVTLDDLVDKRFYSK